MGPSGADLTGVILAAGRGTRMGVLPTALPKVVLPILDEPIVYHQLRMMAGLGIRKAFVVVGFRGHEVVRQIERMPPSGVELHYVEQRQRLGIAHCVGTLERRLDGPFMLFLGDIYFDAPRIGEMLDAFWGHIRDGMCPPDAVLGAIEEKTIAALQRNYCIVSDEAGRAIRVIEKPRHPKSRIKGVGVYLFRPVVFDAIRRTPRTAMRDEYEITDSIQILIEDGYYVRACTCVEADLNVTYPKDLLDINLSLMHAKGLERLIGRQVELGDGAEIVQSVVCSGARVGAGAVLRECLVFPGAAVDPGARLHRAIVTDEGLLSV